MDANAKRNARRWHESLRRADPKDWGRISTRTARRIAGRGNAQAVLDAGKAMEYMQEEGLLEVNITSARPLSASAQKQMLSQLFGSRKVLVNASVDPSLIGGAIVATPNEQWDFSVKNQLERLKRSLSEQ